MNLELFAIRWLRWEKRCEIVLRERSPRAYSCGEPDVVGVTAARYLIEIEIKRSVSDFRADRLKPSRSGRRLDNPNLEWLLKKLPKQFYYLIPAELQARIESEVPLWAGLMIGPTAHNYCLTVVKKAPNNASSQRLTVKECCRLVHAVTRIGLLVKLSATIMHILNLRKGVGNTPSRSLKYDHPIPIPRTGPAHAEAVCQHDDLRRGRRDGDREPPSQ